MMWSVVITHVEVIDGAASTIIKITAVIMIIHDTIELIHLAIVDSSLSDVDVVIQTRT